MTDKADSLRSPRKLTTNLQENEPMSSPSVHETDLARFSREVDKLSLLPLWERVSGMKPGSSCVPKIWRYEELRPELVKAVSLISKKEADRRVLVLENPSLRGTTF